MEDMYYASPVDLSLLDIQACAKEVNFVPELYTEKGEDYLLVNFACTFEGKYTEDYWRFYRLAKDAKASDDIQLERYEKFKPISQFNIQFRTFSISCALPLLQSLLIKYGGWVETMYSDDMYDLSNLDDLVLLGRDRDDD